MEGVWRLLNWCSPRNVTSKVSLSELTSKLSISEIVPTLAASKRNEDGCTESEQSLLNELMPLSLPVCSKQNSGGSQLSWVVMFNLNSILLSKLFALKLSGIWADLETNRDVFTRTKIDHKKREQTSSPPMVMHYNLLLHFSHSNWKYLKLINFEKRVMI